MRCPGGILVRRQKHFSYFLSRWKSSSSLQMYEPPILSLSVHRPWRKPVRPELWSTGWGQIIIQLELKSLAFFHLSSPISKLESLSVHMTAGTAPDACTRSLLWDALTLSLQLALFLQGAHRFSCFRFKIADPLPTFFTLSRRTL